MSRDFIVESSYENCPEGTYQAVLAGIIDLGTQENTMFGNKDPKIALVFELNEKNSKGENFKIYEEFSLYLNEKANLRKLIDGWRGKPFSESEIKAFNLNVLLGLHCLAGVQYNQKGYPHIKTVLNIPKDVPKMDKTTTPFIFKISEWDADLFGTLPERIKKKIMASPEASKTVTKESDTKINEKSESDGDVPF